MSVGGGHGKNQAIAAVITGRIVAGYLRRGGLHTLHAGFGAVHGFLHALPSLLTDARRRRAFSFYEWFMHSPSASISFLA